MLTPLYGGRDKIKRWDTFLCVKIAIIAVSVMYTCIFWKRKEQRNTCVDSIINIIRVKLLLCPGKKEFNLGSSEARSFQFSVSCGCFFLILCYLANTFFFLHISMREELIGEQRSIIIVQLQHHYYRTTKQGFRNHSVVCHL